MTKRSADAIYGGQQINLKLEWEEKPCHLTDPMSLGRTIYTPGTAPMPLNSCKLAPKRVCIREFKVIDTSTDAMIRAKKIQASLSRPDMPSLIKFMHPSICSGGFSLGLSVNFCVHLPSEDCEVILEDEELQLYRTKYLAYKKTLSGGWRGFSIAHKIAVGDVVVFQLVAPCKMKVSKFFHKISQLWCKVTTPSMNFRCTLSDQVIQKSRMLVQAERLRRGLVSR
ncbi:hypothetical protein QQ045_012342 [Rhodiola kirilowii]